MIDFCLVGAGFIGPVHAANVAAHPRARLSWVIDLNLDAADALAKRHGARAGRDLAQALADPSMRAVIVCTPPRTHATIIQAAAQAGKAIFCEKPIDLDMAGVDACADALSRSGVPFCVGFNRRFDPTHRALHAAIRTATSAEPRC